MKKLLILFLTIAATCCLVSAHAAEAKPAAPEKKEARVRATPFRGKIVSIDKQAKTLTVGERVFQITSDTKIVKAGKTATLDDANTGEDVGGAYRETADKKLQAVSVRLGAKPGRAKKENNK